MKQQPLTSDQAQGWMELFAHRLYGNLRSDYFETFKVHEPRVPSIAPENVPNTPPDLGAARYTVQHYGAVIVAGGSRPYLDYQELNEALKRVALSTSRQLRISQTGTELHTYKTAALRPMVEYEGLAVYYEYQKRHDYGDHMFTIRLFVRLPYGAV